MKGVLVDTGFLIRLLKSDETLNKNATDYYRYCLEQQIPLFCSTIAIAEYCVRGKLSELPLKDVRVLPFNIRHAEKAGEFTEITLATRQKSGTYSRDAVKEDAKMFAQAHVEDAIDTFLTADKEAIKLYYSLKKVISVGFDILDLNVPRHENFGELDL